MLEVNGATYCEPEAMLVLCNAGWKLDVVSGGGKPAGTNEPEAGFKLDEPESDREREAIIDGC